MLAVAFCIVKGGLGMVLWLYLRLLVNGLGKDSQMCIFNNIILHQPGNFMGIAVTQVYRFHG